LLAKQPSAKLKVYGVWFNMMTSDQRSQWPSRLLTDRRVSHFWDDGKTLGNWYATFKEFSKGPSDTVWDAFFVYNADAMWTDQPSGLIGWGSTIISHKNQLAEAVTSALKQRARPLASMSRANP
jgi:hypothetical protein